MPDWFTGMETTILSLPLIPVATALVVGVLVAALLLWRRGGQAKVAAVPSSSHARSNGTLAAQETEVDKREKCVILFGECRAGQQDRCASAVRAGRWQGWQGSGSA